ncbi:MAG: hypothetical protein KKA79_01505 [Nanoarchaeota archaeon]|nr:hypothetical protein [Nanoarchaeota archaeon]MCG2718677.1 hypothetical protein [Nanoarchaeota archaeon]
MKLTKTKIFLASAAMALSLTAGCIIVKDKVRDTPAYKECIEDYEGIKQEDYKQGSILIGFDESTTPNEAEEFIESWDFNNELEINPKKSTWFLYTELSVPEGKELDYVCYFRSMAEDTIINYADPNHIIRINPPIIMPK